MEDLHFVRHQLDGLSEARMVRPFDPEVEQTYRELCDREAELLRSKMEPCSLSSYR
jgi:hypothetical protein